MLGHLAAQPTGLRIYLFSKKLRGKSINYLCMSAVKQSLKVYGCMIKHFGLYRKLLVDLTRYYGYHSFLIQLTCRFNLDSILIKQYPGSGV